MNLSWIDWAIMAIALLLLRVVSLSTRRSVKGVSDFLSANRLAGRYLLTISGQMGNVGIVTFIAMFEVLYARGLSPNWWIGFQIPVNVIILLTGWVFYRFRETRALTMAQFLEMRYSRRLRILAGILCWTAGVINFGIFPGVAARFFVYFCGLPDHFHILALSYNIPTIAAVMLVDLGISLYFVNSGGQISVMVSECAQGIFCCFAFIVVSVVILIKVSWGQMVHAMSMAPANESMINPFHTGNVHDFNIWYYLIGLFSAFYTYMSWQGGQGFYSSARSPHEQKMGGIIGMWRDIPKALMVSVLAMATIAIMKLPEFGGTAQVVSATLSHIPNESIRGEMRVPVAMAHFLPVAVKGLLATTFLFFSVTCHDTYMHSWGSIFIQDIYMPLRNRALGPDEHIRLLRWSICGVAVFAFFWSLFYQPTEKLVFFFAITGAIWIGGSGSVIVGGLYWPRGTTAGAYAALITGAVLSVLGLIIPPVYLAQSGHPFPVNGQWLMFLSMVCAAGVYVCVSLATGKRGQEFNIERMLHRGVWAVESVPVEEGEPDPKGWWVSIVGVTKEFSRSDRILAVALVVWNAAWFLWFVGFSLANLVFPVSDSAWANYEFIITIAIPVVLSVPVAIWFTIGGVMDIKSLFMDLAMAVRCETDDGRVEANENEPVATL